MRQHAAPYGKRKKSGHEDHDGHSAADEDERPPGAEVASARTAHEEPTEGFEIII